MKKSKKKTNIFLFFFILLGIFIVFDITSNYLISLFGRSVIVGKYGRNVIAEAIFLVTIIFMIIFSKNQYIFKEKKIGFFKGLTLGLPILIILLFNIDFKALFTANIFDILSLFIFTVLIGLSEEFLCRGWIQNEMLERFGNNRKQVILSLILSGLLFGLMHISNFFLGQGAIETIAQIIQTVAVGFLFGAIYYRSKNIWLVVFLHAFWDFAVMTGDLNLIKDCTFLNPTFKASLASLLGSIPLATIFVTTAIYELRKSKICDNFDEAITIEEMKKEKVTSLLTLFAGFAIYFIFAYFSAPLLNEYTNSKVCYEYTERELENYSLTRQYRDSYQIEYELWDEVNNEESDEPELEWIEDYSYSTTIDNSKLIITNDITDESIELNYTIEDYTIIKSGNSYLIGILVEEKEGSVLYYSNFINEENMSNDSKYLNDLKSSFTRYVLPDSTSMLTLIEEDSDTPLIAVQNNYGFTYIDDDEIYIVYY